MTTRRHIEDLPKGLRAHLAEEHESDQETLAETWAALEGVSPVVSVDSARKADVRAHVLSVAGREMDRRPVESVRIYRIKQFAAAAVVLCLIGFSFLFSPRVETIRAPIGVAVPAVFELPDGTSVSLAAGSRLSYSDRFGPDARDVALTGEAFFDVSSSETPFVIHTYNARTRVLGTRFSIRAWPRELESRTRVLVEEGRVAVSARRGDSVELLAGQATAVQRADASSLESVAIDVDQAFSWLNGGYEYRNEPVGNVINDLSRRFDLIIEAPESLRLRPISIFNQSDGSIDEILGDISATIGAQYRRIAGGYEFYTQ